MPRLGLGFHIDGNGNVAKMRRPAAVVDVSVSAPSRFPSPPRHEPFHGLLLFFWCNNKISESFFFALPSPKTYENQRLQQCPCPPKHPPCATPHPSACRVCCCCCYKLRPQPNTGNHLLYLIFLRFFFFSVDFHKLSIIFYFCPLAVALQ